MARLIDANELKQRILAERDKIPKTLPSAIYEFGIKKPNHHGNSMRGGIRKALRCLEQCQAVDAVPVVRCKDCKYAMDMMPIQNSGCLMGECTLRKEDDIVFTAFGDDFCSYGERRTDYE